MRLTTKRGGKRVYKSVKVLKKQCEKAVKKGKKNLEQLGKVIEEFLLDLISVDLILDTL